MRNGTLSEQSSQSTTVDTEASDLNGGIHPSQLKYDSDNRDRLTHYLFRYPAKFHPPVARSLIEQFSEPGDWILDPFCGSGTILVEAATRGRNAIGIDWDPVAVFVSKFKSHKFDVQRLRASSDKLLSTLDAAERPRAEYDDRQWQDLSEGEYRREVEDELLWIPQIPNLHHWFRRYVTVDMAKILKAVATTNGPKTHKDFMLLSFCSMIRTCSNADPVPVSGLEVTSYMKEKDLRGRVINPFKVFRKLLEHALDAADTFATAKVPGITTLARQCDATRLSSKIRRTVECVITSPPYYTAVDYYRRHQLEMYWLGFTETHDERKKLIPHYIGRRNISSQHPFLKEGIEFGPTGTEWMAKLEDECKEQVNTFKHYAVSLTKVFRQLERVIQPNGKVVIVIGNNKVNGSEMPTVDLLPELAEPAYRLVHKNWYHIKDKYMSYSRNNGADIDTEHVLVFERRR